MDKKKQLQNLKNLPVFRKSQLLGIKGALRSSKIRIRTSIFLKLPLESLALSSEEIIKNIS